MTAELDLPAPTGRSTKVVHVDPATVRISPLNPRVDAPDEPASVAGLAAEIKAVGQINDAHAEKAPDGTYEILAGSRRRAACRLAGKELRIRVHPDLSREEAIAIAYRDDREALKPSLWDLAGGWSRLLDERTVATDIALARLVGHDKSTISRGLALRRTPEAILGAFADLRDISFSQWSELAPLVEDENACARLIERAGLIAGRGYAAPRVARELKAAAAGKTEIKAIEVRNRHDRVIATIQPGHRGDFTVRYKFMTELHPTQRVECAKLVQDRFVDLLRTWFDREA